MSRSPVVAGEYPAITEPDQSRVTIGHHHGWLRDHARTLMLCRAVADAVRPGDVFADLGCGTGVLSMAARRAGARRVFAVEQGHIINVARRVVAANHFDGIDFIQGDSSQVALPEPADVIAIDYLGDGGYHEVLVSLLCDARDRWLTPGGCLIPASVEAMVALAAAPADIVPLTQERMDMSAAEFRAVALTAAASVLSIDFATVQPDRLAGAITLPVMRAGRAAGLITCFESVLARGSSGDRVLTNHPAAAMRSSRPQNFLSFDRAVDVLAGDRAEIEFTANAIAKAFRYRVRIRAADGALRYTGDVSSLDVDAPRSVPRRVSGAAVPRLTPDGAAARAVLAQLDGGQSVRAIAVWLRETHPGIAASMSAAQRFVWSCIDARLVRR